LFTFLEKKRIIRIKLLTVVGQLDVCYGMRTLGAGTGVCPEAAVLLAPVGELGKPWQV